MSSLWEDEEYDEEGVQDYYGDEQSVERRWVDSFAAPQAASSFATQVPSNLVTVITAISKIYLDGSYLSMQPLDGVQWASLGQGSAFQVSQSRLALQVVSGRDYTTTRTVENKIIIKRTLADEGMAWGEAGMRTFVRELRVLHHLRRHPNIVRLRGVGWFYEFEDINPCPKPVLMLEPAESTLDALVGNNVQLAPQTMMEIFADVTFGIQALHGCDIVHGDIKPANVLIFPKKRLHGGVEIERYVAKVSDFSLSLLDLGTGRTQFLGGTQYWTAPEAGDELSLDELKLADVWSLGLLFAVVSTGSQQIIEVSGDVEVCACTVRDHVQSHFEERISTSTWNTDLIEVTIKLYTCTLVVEPAGRNLTSLVQAFREYLLVELNEELDKQHQSKLAPMHPSDVSINYEAFKTLSGSLKDLLVLNLERIVQDGEDERRSKAMYELAVITLSKFASPDASVEEGITYLFTAADAGDIRAKGLYHRLSNFYLRPAFFQVTDTLTEQWLYDAALAGHHVAMDDLMNINASKARTARTEQAIRTFDFKCEDTSVELEGVKDRILLYLSQHNVKTVDEYSTSSRGDNLTHWAAASGNTSFLEILLVVFKASPDTPNELGDTPLILATRFGQYETVKLLVKHGANAATTNNSGENPLHYVWAFGIDKVTEMFFSLEGAGANPFQEAKGRLHDIFLEVLPQVPGIPLERAAARNRLDLVKLFMLMHPILPRNGNISRRLLLWSIRLHNVDMQNFLMKYAQNDNTDDGISGNLCPMIKTTWTHNGQQRSFLEAACLGWISPSRQGSELPINFWGACCHGSDWEGTLEKSLGFLTSLEPQLIEMESSIDRSIKTAFQHQNQEAFSLLLDLKVRITDGSMARLRTVRHLAWKSIDLEVKSITKQIRRRVIRKGLNGTKYLDYPLRVINYVDQIFHDSSSRTLAQQSIMSGDRNLFRMLVKKFKADLTLPANAQDLIPFCLRMRELSRSPPNPENQCNSYCLVAFSTSKDLWFAKELRAMGISFDCPFDKPPVTENFYLPPLFYALTTRFWGYSIWLLSNEASVHQKTTVRSTVLEQVLSIEFVGEDMLKFFFPGCNGSGRGSEFLSRDLRAFAGYPIFRLFYDCVTGGRYGIIDTMGYGNFEKLRCDRNLLLHILYNRALGNMDALENDSTALYRKVYLDSCVNLKTCWEYLLHTYPDVTNCPSLSWYGLSYRPLSVIDQSLRLYSNLRSIYLFGLKANWAILLRFDFIPPIPFPNNLILGNSDSERNEDSEEEAIDNNHLRLTDQADFELREPHAFRGLQTFASTLAHFQQESQFRDQPFPCQSWQSRVFGSPLDLLALNSQYGRLLRQHNWTPSLFHPFVGHALFCLLYIACCFYLVITFFMFHSLLDLIRIGTFWASIYACIMYSLGFLIVLCLSIRHFFHSFAVAKPTLMVSFGISMGQIASEAVMGMAGTFVASIGRMGRERGRLRQRLIKGVGEWSDLMNTQLVIEQILLSFLLFTWFFKLMIDFAYYIEPFLQPPKQTIEPTT